MTLAKENMKVVSPALRIFLTLALVTIGCALAATTENLGFFGIFVGIGAVVQPARRSSSTKSEWIRFVEFTLIITVALLIDHLMIQRWFSLSLFDAPKTMIGGVLTWIVLVSLVLFNHWKILRPSQPPKQESG